MRSGCLAAALSAVVAFTLAGASGRAQAGCVLSKLAELPVTMSGMTPVVAAQFNGRDVRLIVHTGDDYSLIPMSTAVEYKLPLKETPMGILVSEGGHEVRAQVATVSTFTLGGSAQHNVDFLVGGTDWGHGFLGLNILGAFDTEYDFAEGAVRLLKPKDCDRTNLAYWSAGKPVTVVPLQEGLIVPGNAPVINVIMNGVTLNAVLNTATAQSVVSESAARRAGLDLSALVDPTTATHRVHSGRVIVSKLDFGGETISNVKILVSSGASGYYGIVLGADFFLSHRVLISYSQHRVYLTYQGGPVFDAVEHPQMAAANQAMEPAAEPSDADGFSRQGAAYAERGDDARAMADFDKAIALDAKTARYRVQRAEALLKAQKPALAMNDIDAALVLAPDDPDAHLMRARIRLKGDEPADAEADLASAARTAPAEGLQRLAIAQLYTDLNEFKPAIGVYDSWIADHPDDTRLSGALNGRCWARALGNIELDQAVSDCDRAIYLSSRAPHVLDTRGLVRLRRGEYARAIADYDDALKRNPKIAWSLYGRGLAELKTGASDAGRADIAAGEALDPKLAARAAKLGLAPPDAGSRAPATATAAKSPPPVTHAPT